jgi:hypothetical protein
MQGWYKRRETQLSGILMLTSDSAKKYSPHNNINCFPFTNNVSIKLIHNACPLFRGLVLWLGYLGCSILGDWDSLYFFRGCHSIEFGGSGRKSDIML